MKKRNILVKSGTLLILAFFTMILSGARCNNGYLSGGDDDDTGNSVSLSGNLNEGNLNNNGENTDPNTIHTPEPSCLLLLGSGLLGLGIFGGLKRKRN